MTTTGRVGICWGIVAFLCLPSDLLRAEELPRATSVTSRTGMVVTVSPPATDVGAEVLRRGGNAVDAAVAVALAMAVTWPEAGNIGGGGFMMVLPAGGQSPVCIEYRERAPEAATREMFQLGETHFSHKAVGVPGTVRGLELAHRKFGVLPWRSLVEPAVRLAAEGFVVDSTLAASLNGVLKAESTAPFAEFLRVFGRPGGGNWRPGDRLVQRDLARTLSLVAERGSAGFYDGPVAELIVAEMRKGGGLITHRDLAAYTARVRQPVSTTFRGHVVYGPPPPSSGGTVLAETLNILEKFPLREQGRYSATTLHLMSEAMRRSYLDRARHIGDPDQVAIPGHLTSKEYAASLADSIDPDRATPSVSLAGELAIVEESESTTHFSIIDGHGMAVANTYTLEDSFGSRVVVRGGGFLLNDEMGDFNWKPGHTDTQGTIGTEANTIAPGKRMLSSQCPVIVTRDGEAVFVTGSPGGRTIINTVACIVLNALEFEMSPVQAVDASRMHHQWLPDELRLESRSAGTPPLPSERLKEMGHRVKEVARQGDAHTIARDPQTGMLTGVADRRRGGKAAGPD